MVLQEQGKVTDELYFGVKEHEDCQMTLGNEFGRYINAPRQSVGYPENGAIQEKVDKSRQLTKCHTRRLKREDKRVQ